MKILEQLKNRREALGLSAYKLAKLAGINTSKVGTMESGSHLPNLTTLNKVAEAMGCEIVLQEKK